MSELLPYEPGSPEWLAARRAGVTATDIVTILGLSSYDSVYSLFWRKMGQVPEVPDSDRFRLGRELEPYVRERWAQEQKGPWHFEGCGLYRNDVRPWQMATPDYLVGPGLDYREPLTGVLECKTWADADRHSWGGGYARYKGRIGDDGEHLDPEPVQPPAGNQIPATVRVQVLWQMDVMDVGTGHVGVVFLPSGEFRSYVIEHDESPIDQYPHDPMAQLWPEGCRACLDLQLMRAEGEEFMARLRLELPPPDPDFSAATLAAVRARFTRQPDKTAEVDAYTWIDWKASKDDEKYYSDLARGLEIRLREQAGEASVLTVDGQPVARRVITDAQVKAHVRHQDYLKRIKQGDGDAADA